MKVPAALLSLALASAAVAQGTPELPDCAKNCADKFLQAGIGNCGKDVKCICSDKDFLGNIACCLVGVCDQASQTQAVQFALGLCKGAGVNDLPTAVSCTATTASSTAAGTAATSGATSGSATDSQTSPAPTGTGAAASQASSASSSTGTSSSHNIGPRQTAAAGLGAIGGIVAAVALL